MPSSIKVLILLHLLKDRIVCGVCHEGIQKKLLAEKELDFDKAYSIAIAIEAAEKDTKNLAQSSTTTQPVLFTRSKAPSTPRANPRRPQPTEHDKASGVSCYRCGGDHLAPACRHLNTECSYCKKKGHLARVCHSRKKAQEQDN